MNVKITKYILSNYLCVPARKFAAKKWDFLREVYDDLSLKELYDDKT